MDFSAFSKVELHLHLDCSLSYNVVRRINPVRAGFPALRGNSLRTSFAYGQEPLTNVGVAARPRTTRGNTAIARVPEVRSV
jgi:hypothetical protein